MPDMSYPLIGGGGPILTEGDALPWVATEGWCKANKVKAETLPYLLPNSPPNSHDKSRPSFSLFGVLSAPGLSVFSPKISVRCVCKLVILD
ncbi:hypothetical protein L1049_014309 [Liquidambar formosana]|uniref:Uncharacterized protein n=1 Tax=Liquidambar formosana TaxID=63359 RepID=A0AAP0WUU6_LIQFO